MSFQCRLRQLSMVYDVFIFRLVVEVLEVACWKQSKETLGFLTIMDSSSIIFFLLFSSATTIQDGVLVSGSGLHAKNPTIVRHTPFDPAADVLKLRSAMFKVGTDEDAIIDIATKRTLEQRLEIRRKFSSKYNKDLINNFERELSGTLLTLIKGLFLTTSEFVAQTIKDAVIHGGTHDQALVEVFCCIPDIPMSQISQKYTKMFSKNMKTEVIHDVSGDFESLLVALMENKRRPYVKDEVEALQNAQELVEAGEWMGTTERSFIDVFSKSSLKELVDISEQYLKLTNITLEKLISSETSGNFEDLLLSILSYAKNPVEHYAKLLDNAFTQNKFNILRQRRAEIVTWVLVTRSEVDLNDIMAKYHSITKRALAKDVERAFMMDFEQTCLSILKGNK